MIKYMYTYCDQTVSAMPWGCKIVRQLIDLRKSLPLILVFVVTTAQIIVACHKQVSFVFCILNFPFSPLLP
jgi:hypothetical protein